MLISSRLNLYLDIKHLYIETSMKKAKNMGLDTSGVHLWLILWKAFRAMEGHADRSIAGLGLCRSDFGVMEALLHKGPLAVKALGEKVLLTSGSMTAAVDRLERRDWVTRGDDPEDRRSRIVRLTAGGRKTIRALFADHERDMEQAAAGLSRAERTELEGLLKKLGTGAIEVDALRAEERVNKNGRSRLEALSQARRAGLRFDLSHPSQKARRMGHPQTRFALKNEGTRTGDRD